jgi:hypothetical protein
MTTRSANTPDAVGQRWEYAVLTMDAGGNMFWVGYSGPDTVETTDHALRNFGGALGELGSKGWELVSVAQSANQQGGLDEKLYFKRPHDPARPLQD